MFNQQANQPTTNRPAIYPTNQPSNPNKKNKEIDQATSCQTNEPTNLAKGCRVDGSHSILGAEVNIVEVDGIPMWRYSSPYSKWKTDLHFHQRHGSTCSHHLLILHNNDNRDLLIWIIVIFVIMVIIILIITTLEYRPPQPNDNARPSRPELPASSAVYLFYQDENIFL